MEELTKHGESEQEQMVKRPQLLALLLIFSMVNGVISSMSNFILFSVIDVIKESFSADDTMNVLGMEIKMSLFLNTDKKFFLYQGILYAVSFLGALLMWKYRRAGFHYYTVSQILLLIVATLYLPGMPFPFVDLMLTGIFVYVYAKNLHLMH
jgi:hypothetical protein